jgi:hypothetical protein
MLFFSRNIKHSKNSMCAIVLYGMPEYALFLRLLAEEVYTARLRGRQRVIDASDFREWLLEAAEKAQDSRTLDEFFSRLRRSV